MKWMAKLKDHYLTLSLALQLAHINGSVLVSQFLKKRKEGLNISLAWREAAGNLVEFWKHLSSHSVNIDEVLKDSSFSDFEKMIKKWKNDSTRVQMTLLLGRLLNDIFMERFTQKWP